MAYPTLAPNCTWYKGNTKRSNISEIRIVDMYTPTGGVTESWNADTENIGRIKCYVIGTELVIAGNGSGGIYANDNSECAFSDTSYNDCFKNATIINGLELLDTSNVTTAKSMFDSCEKVKTLSIGSWNVQNVIDFTGMFFHCNAMTTLDIRNWDVSAAGSFNNMFNGCRIETVDLSKWNTASLTSIRRMFYRCTALKNVDLSYWNTSRVTNLEGVFYECSSLERVHLLGWDTANVTNIVAMFKTCTALRRIYVSSPWDLSSVTSGGGTFLDCSNLEGGAGTTYAESACDYDRAVIDNGGSTPGYFTFMGEECLADPHKIWMIADSVRSATGKDSTFGLSDIVAEVGNFKPCLSARRSWYKSTSMDISEITEIRICHSYIENENTSEQWNADALDAGSIKCYREGTALYIVGRELYLSADSAELFSGMTSLTSIVGLGNFDTTYVETLDDAFSGDSSLLVIDLSGWDLSAVTSADRMFNDCHAVTEINLGNGLKVVGERMFRKCAHLNTISGLSLVTSIGIRAFCHTPVLSSVDLNGNLITFIGEQACRKSSIEDCVDLSMVPLDNIERLATRRKRWTSAQLETIQATKPAAITIEIPNADYQDKYFGIYGPTRDGEYLTIEASACRAFALYHICNANRNRKGETPYTSWEDWWNSAVENAYTGVGTFTYNAHKVDPNYHIDSKLWVRHILSASGLSWVNNEAIPTIDITTDANSKEIIIAHLADTGLPLYVSVPSTNSSSRHAVVVCGYDPVTDKIAICNSAVYGPYGVTSWYKFEDVFSAPFTVDGSTKKDTYYDIVSA